MGRREDLTKQAAELWAKTAGQVEELVAVLKMRQAFERVRSDTAKLVAERDRLLRKLGEETYRLIEKRHLQVPKPLEQLAGRVRGVALKLLGQLDVEGPSRPAAKKPAAKGRSKAAGKTAAGTKAAKKRTVKRKKSTARKKTTAAKGQ